MNYVNSWKYLYTCTGQEAAGSSLRPEQSDHSFTSYWQNTESPWQSEPGVVINWINYVKSRKYLKTCKAQESNRPSLGPK